MKTLLNGRGVSKGLGLGSVVLFEDAIHSEDLKKSSQLSPEKEKSRLFHAVSTVQARLKELHAKAKTTAGSHDAAIFEAHLQMIEDPELSDAITQHIDQSLATAEWAVWQGFDTFIQIFAASDSDYMRERVLDLKDLRTQTLNELMGRSTSQIPVSGPLILLAKDLTPSQTFSVDRSRLQGLVSEQGGETSHTAILARSLGVAAITGVKGAADAVRGLQKQLFVIDGKAGTLALIESDAERERVEHQIKTDLAKKEKLKVFAGKQSRTKDGRGIKLQGNIGSPNESALLVETGAEGVGLFRTEFLFMERAQAPTLDEQREAYRTVLNALPNYSITLRTLDVGGDKIIPYLKFPKEMNPFLGLRAIRFCFENPDVFETQVKAMLLANEHGNLKILIPMISQASEAKRTAAWVKKCAHELRQQGHDLKPYHVGAMIEIPSLAFELDQLLPEVDFVSVGTNDLLQYFLAVDRMQPELQGLYNPYTLGFLRLMDKIAKDAKRAGLRLSICGELGGHFHFMPLWIAMGYDCLSLTAAQILERREYVSRLTVADCNALLGRVLLSDSEITVKEHLVKFYEVRA